MCNEQCNDDGELRAKIVAAVLAGDDAEAARLIAMLGRRGCGSCAESYGAFGADAASAIALFALGNQVLSTFLASWRRFSKSFHTNVSA